MPTTSKITIASGDPRVVMFNTKGLSDQRRCVGQYGAGRGEARRHRGTRREVRQRRRRPRRGCRREGERKSARSGVYRNVVRLYALQSAFRFLTCLRPAQSTERREGERATYSPISQPIRSTSHPAALDPGIRFHIKLVPSVITRQSTSVYFNPPNCSGWVSTWYAQITSPN